MLFYQKYLLQLISDCDAEIFKNGFSFKALFAILKLGFTKHCQLEIRSIDLTLSFFMTFAAFLVILSLEMKHARAFCFLVRAKIGELTFPLAAGPDILKAPFSLKHDNTFATNDYDCQVMNQGADTFDAVVHCCYTGANLKYEGKWTNEDYRELLRLIYFR